MMECGQPLHTFDYAKLDGREIIVRRPLRDESIEAIDHKTYQLDADFCVIADARRAVAIAGVMGGAATEVNEATCDVLIEAAEFDPVSVRTTARRLGLHSDSSYRFERGVDAEGVDWASRRCAELILETAGGELAAGVVDVGRRQQARQPIVLRLSQLKRILGIEVEPEVVRRILLALGNEEWTGRGGEGRWAKDISASPLVSPPSPLSLSFTPPSWRRDLSREIDLIEEVARIHGYDKIPEDVSVPMAASARRHDDRVTAKIRSVLTAAGCDEAMTLSAVDEAAARAVAAWTHGEPIRSRTPVIRGADCLRTSLVPSLLAVRRTNESLSNPVIELFEIAKVYLPAGAGKSEEGRGETRRGDSLFVPPLPASLSPHSSLPEERWMLGLTSGRAFLEVKGLIEAVLAVLDPRLSDEVEFEPSNLPLLDPQASCRLVLEGQLLGYVGQLSAAGRKQADLRGPATVAELKLAPLFERAVLVPHYVPLPAFPAVSRDLNLVVDEAVLWAQVAATVRRQGGPQLESLEYRDTYRDAQRLGPGKKSLLFSIGLRWEEGTLTSQQADAVRDRIVAACRQEHGAELRA